MRRIEFGRVRVASRVSFIVYLLRKPAPVVEAARRYETGGIDLDATRPPSGTWPTNVMLAHLASCTRAACAPGCPVRAAEDALGDNVRSVSVVREPIDEESPW